MKNTDILATVVCRGAYTLFTCSALLGGHLTASYLLLEPDQNSLEVYIGGVGATIGLNALYFLVCLVTAIVKPNDRRMLVKAAVSLLLNIPIAIGCFLIFISYAF